MERRRAASFSVVTTIVSSGISEKVRFIKAMLEGVNAWWSGKRNGVT